MSKNQPPLPKADFLSVWPGLPGLWCHGSIRALAVALFFSNLLVVAILATFVWPELLRMGPKAVVCFSVAVFWAVFSIPQIRAQLQRRKDLRSNGNLKHLFRVAQTEYLRGNWFQAESLLTQLLDVYTDDVDARLLLATLLRRIGRFEASAKQLDYVEQAPGGHRWRLEIEGERRLLASPAATGLTKSAAIEAA